MFMSIKETISYLNTIRTMWATHCHIFIFLILLINIVDILYYIDLMLWLAINFYVVTFNRYKQWMAQDVD